MKHAAHLVLGQHALDQIGVADIARHAARLLVQPAAVVLGLRHPVADQAHHVRACIHEPPHQRLYHGLRPTAHATATTQIS